MFGLIAASLILLLLIAYQDLKTYSISWILFPLLAIILASIHVIKLPQINVFWSIAINFAIVSVILFLLYIYSKYKIRQPFKSVFGLGDILFFYAFALGFPSVSFIILFVFSILFSLIIHISINAISEEKHVPLAGFMAIFLILALIIDSIIPTVSLYSY